MLSKSFDNESKKHVDETAKKETIIKTKNMRSWCPKTSSIQGFNDGSPPQARSIKALWSFIDLQDLNYWLYSKLRLNLYFWFSWTLLESLLLHCDANIHSMIFPTIKNCNVLKLIRNKIDVKRKTLILERYNGNTRERGARASIGAIIDWLSRMTFAVLIREPIKIAKFLCVFCIKVWQFDWKGYHLSVNTTFVFRGAKSIGC